MAMSLRLMSWNIQKKQTNFKFIAKMMELNQIDIAALLEVPNSAYFTICFGIIAELNNLNYSAGIWQFKAINVGDEAVAYIWREAAAASATSFRALVATNAAQSQVRGPVLKNAAGALIYFPKTQTSWASLPGKSKGRRAAYCAFQTNDGAAARIFTFLDIHTPFNTNSLIQAYSAYVYSTARELMAVQTVDAVSAMTNALHASLAPIVAQISPLIPNTLALQPAQIAARIAAAATNRVVAQATLAFGQGLEIAMAMRWGVDAAAADVGAGLNGAFGAPGAVSLANLNALTNAYSQAVVMAGAYLGASIQPATAPLAAAGAPAVAAAAAAALVPGVLDVPAMPGKRSPATLASAIRGSTRLTVDAVFAQFAFGALPTQNVNASVAAGDFNINFPDAVAYPAPLNNGSNAYTSLLALAAGNGASIQDTTTRSTDFNAPFIRLLINPIPIQHNNPGNAATYVPLDVTSMVGKNCMGHDAWVRALQSLAQNQHLPWAPLTQAPYDALIDAAFGAASIEITRLYRANSYDNMFVRAANVTSRGMLDVMDELAGFPIGHAVGNPVPLNFAPNPWPAARGRLNAAARALVASNGVTTFRYGGVPFTISPNLDDAQSAAIFFDRYVSDHLPVYVEISV